MDTFVLKVEKELGLKWQLRIVGPGERVVVERPLEASKLDQFARDIQTSYGQTAPPLSDLAAQLSEWLTGSSNQRLDGPGQQSAGLTLHIETDHALRHAPWEVMETEGIFHGRGPHGLFMPVRRVSTRCSQVRPQSRPLRVAFMACSPEDAEPCSNVEDEQLFLLDATQGQPITLLVEESGNLKGLAVLARSQPEGIDVLHIRSFVDIAADQPRLVFEDDMGLQQAVGAEDIAAVFEKRWPRLTFISSYERERSDDRAALNSLCEALVGLGAPTVLEWSLPARNAESRAAAATLFSCFAEGLTTDEAVARTRQALLANGSAHWHRLRLYADASSPAALVTPPTAEVRTPVLRPHLADDKIREHGTPPVAPDHRFVGRRRLIQRCLRVLNSPGSAACQGVHIHGPRGLGKSSVAAHLCQRLHSTHQRLQWTIHASVLDLSTLVERIRFSDSEIKLQARQIAERDDLPFQARLRSLFAGPLSGSRIVFVFDDFEPGHQGPASTGSETHNSGALEALSVLLRGIKASGSESRVVVTSVELFPLPAGVALHPERLEPLRGADLKKKRRQLCRLGSVVEVTDPLPMRASAAADGNPRLMERLDRLLADPGIDHQAVVAAIENRNQAERDDILSRVLIRQLEAPERRLLALLSLFRLPVGCGAMTAVAGEDGFDAFLNRAVALGLVEEGRDEATDERRYRVRTTLSKALAEDLNAEERRQALRRTVHFLQQTTLNESKAGAEMRFLEIHRLASLAAEGEIVADAANRLAHSYHASGRNEAAVGLLQETRKVLAQILGPDHPVPLTCGNNLAAAHRACGHVAEAVRLHRETLDARERVLGPEHPHTFTSRNNLALAYLDAGCGQDAMGLLVTSVTVMAEVLGRAHPTTLTSRHTLALAYRDARRCKDANEVLEETLETTERILGPRHPHTLTSRNNLALAYRDAGRYQESVALLRQALDIMSEVYGPEHLDTRTCRTTLAFVEHHPGCNEITIGPLRETVQARERTLGPEHVDTLASRGELARAYRDAGRHDEAIRLLQATLKMREQSLGHGHPITVASRHTLAEVYLAANRDEEADALQKAD